MRDEDVETVHEMECLIYDDPWSFSNFRHEISKSTVSLPMVAENKSEIIGYIVPWFIADEMHLANIATSSLYLRQGIADQLMTVVIEEAIIRKIRLIYLEVRPTNLKAVRLYRKIGFEKIGTRRRYYRNGEDAIIMHRFLPNSDIKSRFAAG